MTAYRFVTLTCDECGEIFDQQDQTIPGARKSARRQAWQFDRRRGDTCPLHNGWTRNSFDGHYERETPAPARC